MTIQNHGENVNLFAELALISEAWAKNVRVSVDMKGIITAVESGVEPNQHDTLLRNRILLPAMANLHSHSFQRAMAGLTEKRVEKQDSFWSWRKLMYSFLERLNPEHVEAIAALVFMEMLESGFASVGEFHYLHHQQGGQPYENIAETSSRIIAAAKQTGIGLTHLPVFYMQGGLDGKELAQGQLRFGNNTEQFLRVLEQIEKQMHDASEDFLLGMAPHSLRAVSPEALKEIVKTRKSGPVHIHISEQLKEVEDVQNYYGMRPVNWLLENVSVDSQWCLVHATHMTSEETVNLAESGAVAGLCPITEANLGDGIFSGTDYISAGGKYGVGSDSNVRISLAEELRMLEYSQRLVRKERNVMTDISGSVGKSLYISSLKGGAQALSRNSGSIASGQWADLLTLDSDALAVFGSAEDEILDRWIFSGDDSLVRDVWSAGRQMVIDGRHIKHEQIEQKYRSCIQELY
jgi:formiminoglutamate deiminase